MISYGLNLSCFASTALLDCYINGPQQGLGIVIGMGWVVGNRPSWEYYTWGGGGGAISSTGVGHLERGQGVEC